MARPRWLVASRSIRPLRTMAGPPVMRVEYPLQGRVAVSSAVRGRRRGPHARAGAVGGVGEVEQVGAFGVVELQRPGDGVEHRRR